MLISEYVFILVMKGCIIIKMLLVNDNFFSIDMDMCWILCGMVINFN